MPYLGNQHNVGDHVNNFKVLDDISSHTATFDGSATSVINTTNNTIRVPLHRFIQGQRVTYTNGGGGNIGGLTTGTAYFVSFDSANTIKLATTLANANSNTVINLSAVGSGTSHTLNAAFDGVNTKFKMTHSSGKAARLNNATQINVAINNVIQRPNLDPNNFNDGFALQDNHKIVFKTAPTSNDIFWGSIIANTIENFDLRDNEVDNFTGDGSTTEFTLSTIPANNESVIVSINGVVQHPSDKNTARSYTLIDSIIEFTAAPALGDEIQVRHIGFAGASTNDVSGFYGRTGNVALTSNDHITTGDITSRNINSSGIITASSFDGTFSSNVGGSNANFSGIVTAGVFKGGDIEGRNLKITGLSTFVGDASFSGNVSIGGTLTYEDVTNIDSVGIITARTGLNVSSGTATFAGAIDANGDLDVDGHTNLDNVSVAGVVTATTFVGALTGNATGLSGNPSINLTDLDVDGHTNLDNVSIAGITTTTGNIHLNSGAKVGFATDSNTFIGQDDHDRLDFNVGGKRLASIVEGTNIPVLIIDKDGVNNARSNQGTNYNANPHATELVLGNTSSNNHGMTIVSPSSGYGNIQFSDGSGGGLDATRGTIVFTHSDNKLNLKSKLGSIVLTHKDDDKLTTTDAGISIPKDLDVDGHTNLDNVSIAGVATATTFVGALTGTASGNPTLTGGSNNRVVTATGANAITGESNLTFSGSNLTVTNSSGASELTLTTPNNTDGGVYFRTGSTNAGAVSYLHTDNSMKFRVNSTNKMIIDSSGQVAINATSPQSMLEVAESSTGQSETQKRIAIFRKNGTAAGDEGYIHLTTMTGHYGVKLGFTNEGASPTYLNQGFFISTVHGNENITNHTKKFVIASDGTLTLKNNSGMMIDLQSSAANGSTWIEFSDTDGTRKGYLGYGSGSNNTMYLVQQKANNMEFYSNNSTRFLIQSNGKKVVQNGNINISSTYIDFSGDVSTPSTAAAIFRPADNTLAFSTANEERLRITSGGGLGLNTSTVRENIHTHQADSSQNYLRFTNTGTGTGSTDGFNIGITAAEEPIIWNFENTDMYFATNNTERLRITSTGRLGINNDSPQYLMHAKHNGQGGNQRIDLHMTNDTTGHNNNDGVQFGYQNSAGAYIWNFEDTDIYMATNNVKKFEIESGAQYGRIKALDNFDNFVPLQNINGHIKHPNHTTSNKTNLAVGWYTIAVNDGSRASARFNLIDRAGSRHQSFTFYASHHYGGANAQNAINVVHAGGRHSSNPIQALRILANGTYDGAMLQVYIAQTSNVIMASIDGSNMNTNGWVMKDWIADGTNPGGLNNWSSIANNGGEAAYANLTQINSGGMSCDGNFIPGFDNAVSHLGTSARRWVRVYAGDGTINTSDETLKQDITTLTTAEMNAAKRLSKLFVTYKWKKSVSEKGEKARTHTGIIAQRVKAEMIAAGLDPTQYSFYCEDEKYTMPDGTVVDLIDQNLTNDEVVPDNYVPSLVQPAGSTKSTTYSICYTELLAFIAAYNEQRFTSIETRLAALEGS